MQLYSIFKNITLTHGLNVKKGFVLLCFKFEFMWIAAEENLYNIDFAKRFLVFSASVEMILNSAFELLQ